MADGITRELACGRCGHLHMGVTRVHAKEQVAGFNAYFDTLHPEVQQSDYGGNKSSIERYSRCFRCGAPHTQMRPAKDGEGPNGVTMQPIIDELAVG